MHDAEQQAKRAAMEADRYSNAKCETAQANMGGALGYGAVDTEYRPTLRDRLTRTIQDHGSQQRRARNANELFDLLNKHPEVARILELMEDVGR